ncbi:cycloeucalenol cycloisomerase [Klebsormidium nitens]|uniref:Cycloeucalenol cycloisomerase n=1 Tax=Klebsormidium nitens TaxID=105231 RepID=A0A1Y1HK58_KLENI|nr:cycloeucalenol cycloisomerase [Klebsormidium nitens]|eukprot:GAQ78954.1 cycloeucalenol cycloisomerase [Klebsormidium nitens]
MAAPKQAEEPDPSRGLQKTQSLWLAESPSKRWTERFFLWYSPVWIIWALGIVVPFQLYERFNELEYLIVGLAAALPCCILPIFIVGKADRGRPYHERHWVKANVWIAIFSFIGNYFWTHYFYSLLGATYTFPSWRLNDVRSWHLSALHLSQITHAIKGRSYPVRLAANTVVVIAFAYFTAFMETFTITHFKYYTFVDKAAMYKVGSLFYAIYFFVSFPMYFRMDEKVNVQWAVGQAAIDAFASGMMVTIILDLWRLCIGPIYQIGDGDRTFGSPEKVSWINQ